MRRFCVVTCAAIVACGSAFAQQVEAGEWINLFDGETLFGWTILNDGEWEVSEGAISVRKGTGGLLATTSQFMDFELEAIIKVDAGKTAGIAVRSPLQGHPTENGAALVALSTPEGAEPAWQTVTITALGDSVKAAVDGAAVEGLSAANRMGHVCIHYHGMRARVEVKSVKVRPLQLTPIFNGTDLSGWNIFPDRKSKFAVVDGALNILDGNGQIETDALYKNFVLQLNIISNGEHLNSGVFFRGPKAVFWKGYESQVRNEWMRDDRTRPVDYGTGGIYAVQAARKVVSTDGEWFSKTILCNDNHMAVWINGYQVSDFIDTRPINEEGDGKAGYVNQAGTIHLQGHDPTTDLSFKDINIQVYP
jgi:hypothetical protein